jgi:hypothetical protein
MNAIGRTTSRISNTPLSLVGGHYNRKPTAVELHRIKLKLRQVMWRDSEGPDKKVSRHLGCLVTYGRTSVQAKMAQFCLHNQPNHAKVEPFFPARWWTHLR